MSFLVLILFLRVLIVRAMFLPCALHGVEASYLSKGSFLKLRAAAMRAVWSRKQPLACSVSVLGLLDGPHGFDPCFCIVWFRFRLFRRYLSFRPDEVPRLYRLLDLVHDGCSGHGPIHALVAGAHRIGFSWDSLMTRWDRPGLSGLSDLAGPIQYFQSAILDAWRNKVAADLCARRGFRGGPLLDIPGSHQLLNSSHVRERDKAVLRSIMVGGVWNGFLLGKVGGEVVSCRFCGGADGDGHLFWECPYPPLLRFAKILSFTIS